MAWMFSDNDRTKADVDHPVSGISRHPAYLHCTQVEDTDIESFDICILCFETYVYFGLKHMYTLYLQIQHLFTGHIWPRKRRHLTDGEGGGGGEVGGAGDHDGGGREAGQPVDGEGHPPPHWQTRKCHRQPPASGCLDRYHFSTQKYFVKSFTRQPEFTISILSLLKVAFSESRLQPLWVNSKLILWILAAV